MQEDNKYANQEQQETLRQDIREGCEPALSETDENISSNGVSPEIKKDDRQIKKRKRKVLIKLASFLAIFYAVLFGVSVLLAHMDIQKLKDEMRKNETEQEQETVDEIASRITEDSRISDVTEETPSTSAYDNTPMEDPFADTERNTEHDTEEAEEPEDTEADETEPATEEIKIPTVNYGDENVDFVCDDYHYVYENPEYAYWVVYFYEDDILQYEKYEEFDSPKEAKEYLEVLNKSNAMAYPEIKDIYVRNNYVVTEFKETMWRGTKVHHLDGMFKKFKITPENLEQKKEEKRLKELERQKQKALQDEQTQETENTTETITEEKEKPDNR